MTKKGDKYECGTCGVVMVVDEACGCSECDVVCCGAPMKPVKSATTAKATAAKVTPPKTPTKK